MERRDHQIIIKLLSEIRVIEELLEGYDEPRFMSDERTSRAACMTLLNIGELVKNLSDGIKADNPDVPWRAIAGIFVVDHLAGYPHKTLVTRSSLPRRILKFMNYILQKPSACARIGGK